MWSTKLFWKLFLPYAVLVVLAVGVCLAFVSDRHEERLIGQVERELDTAVTLVADRVKTQLAEGPSSKLQSEIESLGSVTDCRFTLIAVDGQVLADSGQQSLEEVAEMDNHLTREEFVKAQSEGTGKALRESATLGVPFLYFAEPVFNDGQLVGFARAARPVAAIQAEVSSLRRVIGIVGLLVGITCLTLTYWLTNRIIRPLQTLTDATGLIASGEYPQRVEVSTEDEVGTLARSFELMSHELSSRENQLRENMQRQTTVLGGMIEGVIAVDREQHVLFANVAAGRKLGFQPEHVEGWTLLEVVRSYELRELVQQAFDSLEYQQREIQWVTDVELCLEVNATPLPGRPCPGVVIVLHDVTDIRRLEGLRQQFVANVSHELKTPLSSIKAFTETLLEGALEDSQHARSFLERIDQQADRLHDLIIDMLSLARIESREATLELSDVQLASVVEQCIKANEAQAAAKDISISNEVQDGSLCVRADEEGLLQILSNLVDNAIKYTPGGGTVTIRCFEELGQAVIEVVDTGVGIAPIHLDRLFERFYRVDKARSRELGGTGLGLSIVKHLCQSMGGSVSVESTLHKGSAFRIRFPKASQTKKASN